MEVPDRGDMEGGSVMVEKEFIFPLCKSQLFMSSAALLTYLFNFLAVSGLS